MELLNFIQNSIINNIKNVYIYSLDKNYNFIFFNNAYRELIKKTWGEDINIGDNIFKLMPVELVDKHKLAFDRVLNGESFFLLQDVSEEFVYKPGQVPSLENITKIRYEEHAYNPIFHNGEIVGLTVIIIDITDRIETENALRKAKEEAESIAKLKSQFLANVSHEIRTPMNAIIGMTKLALEQKDLNKIKEYLKIIDSSAQTLLKLINDILDFSKIEAGKIELENIEFNLDNLLTEINNFFIPKVREKNIELKFYKEPNTPSYLIGDPLRLTQILNNLISNAIKFTHQGNILVRVKSLEQTEDIVNLQFLIKDTGIGIEKDKQDKLFDAFTQADGSITRKYGGTGLGLAICKKLLKIMGGDIWVESELGKGSSFYFTLSFELAKKVLITKESNETTKQDYHNLKNSHILVVEDNEPNQIVLREYLTNIDINVDIASDGYEAINMVTKKNYDAILMDIHMPYLDGLETTKIIRKLKSISELPIIAITANVFKDYNKKFEQIGINDCIYKPIIPKQLYDTLNFWIKNKNIEIRDLNEIKPIFLELYKLVKNKDIEAEDIVYQLNKYFKNTKFYDKFNELTNKIKNYDFNEAFELIKDISKELDLL